MARPNEVVAALLQEYADLISITGGDAYRVRVYDRAARSVAGYHADVSTLDRDGLREIPNVGGTIADKILEYLHSGRIAAVEKLRATVPAGVRELTAIPTLGPRKAMVLYQELGVSSGTRAGTGDRGRLAGRAARSRRGLQVDLRVVLPAAWGAALQYFTGSKAHNIRVREIAVRKGLKLSEYGLFRVEDDSLVVSETEQEVYEHLGLPWIPPTLREDRGEIEAALAGELPQLLTVADIQGDLHTHTDLTDGVAPLADMLAAAEAYGYQYYAVTDHAKNLPMQRMTDAKMLAQRGQLRTLAAEFNLALLHGTELNIDPDGNVDWDPEFLSGFDLCVASVHSHFQQSREAMTRRLVRACEHPYVNIIGHPMTRQIGKREPVDADFDAVFAAAARTGTALEVNSFPDRLDLSDELVGRAKRYGVRFAVNTDAHATGHLAHLRYRVGTAQRGWLTATEVINAWPLAQLREFIAAKRRR